MQNTLFRRYQRVLKKADGGSLPWLQGTQIGTGIIDAFDRPDDLGYQSKSGMIGKSILGMAGTGATIGSAIPGIGTGLGAGIGAVAGLTSGIIGANKASKQERQMRNAMAFQQMQQANQFSQASLASNPELAVGTQNQTYFKDGGSIHIKPSHRGRFTAYLKRTGSTLSEALHSKNAHVRQMANFARNAKKWKHEYGGTMGKYIKCANGGELGGADRSPLTDMVASGGNAKAVSSDNTIIRGNSHAEGGIKIPGLSAEVEGGETTLDNFVFSKKLGFADIHAKIAKSKGIIEKKPQTLERANALRRLRMKEKELAQEQESLKSLIA